MCGIAGVITASEAAVRKALRTMVCAQAHRGPDDEGEFASAFGPQYLGLGHRRLSILDLSPLGHQPMQHPQSRDVLIFNGEIYNYRALRDELLRAGETFRSTGDTEVLLHGLARHGPQFLTRLQGMYALAFLNASDRTLLLARDPAGMKPLYLGLTDKAVVFGSETRSIIASGLIPKDLDAAGIAGLLSYGAMQHPHTMYKHVQSFPPGHYQIIPDRGFTSASAPTAFWRYPSLDTTMTETDAVIQIEKTLDIAVRDHLESDVPVGVFLSSGLDSTVIAGLAAKHSPHVRSFTVGFADHPDMSELALARETAKLFDLTHTEIHIDGDSAEQATLRWVQSIDQPSIDGLNVYVISKAVRNHGIKVALSGQGGDELFGGYPSFADVPRMHRWMNVLRWLPAPLRRVFGDLATTGRNQAVRHKMRDLLGTDGSVRALYLQRRRLMSASQLRRLGIKDDSLFVLPPIPQPDADLASHDAIAYISRLESSYYQGNMLLRDGDANAMAHGLEVRLPMLDQRMLGLMHRLPGSLRCPNGVADKHLLRLAFAPYLRSSLLTQAKRGFSLPIGRWMRGPMRDLCEHAMSHLKGTGLLNSEGIDRMWHSFLDEPESPLWSRVFALCVLGLRLKEVSESYVPATPVD